MNKLIPIILSASILSGCATINGQDPTARNVAGIIVGALIIGGLVALAANQADEPDATVVTKGPNGTYVTEIYR